MKSSIKNLIISLLIMCVVSCNPRNKTTAKEKFFPVLSFLQSQVADIDTSLYSIRKIVVTDSLNSDTIYLPREQFREAAKDFLLIPDLSTAEYEKRYTEEKQFDETMNRVILTYIPLKPEKEIIQKQEVLIKPDPSGDKITNILISEAINSRDSTIQKKLFWKVNESFQVITVKQLMGKPETSVTVKVVWSEND
ncbi:MAG: hypothetical protein ACSLE0_22705 [Chitinophagaceae bacterium]